MCVWRVRVEEGVTAETVQVYFIITNYYLLKHWL